MFRARAALDDAQVVELARLAMTLETTLGWPVDAECAYQDGRLYLLQCRPITNLPDGVISARRIAVCKEVRMLENLPTPSIPAPLPIAPDFPFTWEQPDDAQLFWTFDPTLSDALSPLAYAYLRDCMDGFNAAAAAYALLMRLETRSINTYLYQAIVPL